MRATRISPWVILLSLAAIVPSTSDVRAADHDFETNIVYRLLSVEEVNGQLVIEAEGTGQSSLLGTVTAAATVTQSESPDPCFSYNANFFLSAAAGTIQIHGGGTVCPPPAQITGEWTVTGGDGCLPECDRVRDRGRQAELHRQRPRGRPFAGDPLLRRAWDSPLISRVLRTASSVRAGVPGSLCLLRSAEESAITMQETGYELSGLWLPLSCRSKKSARPEGSANGATGVL